MKTEGLKDATLLWYYSPVAKILLVEDERVIRDEIKRILTRNGHEVTDVASVSEAEGLRPELFALVITDVRLTGETGDVLIERVGQVPVIVMTAYGSVSAAVDGIDALDPVPQAVPFRLVADVDEGADEQVGQERSVGNARGGRSRHHLGPDLAMLDEKKRTTAYILQAILEPSKEIEEKYQSNTFVLNSGKIITGMVVEEPSTKRMR